jgi:hypothetical protein
LFGESRSVTIFFARRKLMVCRHKSIFNWINYWTGKDEELIQDIVIKQ